MARPSFYQMLKNGKRAPAAEIDEQTETNEALLTLTCLLTGAGGAAIDDARVRRLEAWLEAQHH